MNEMTVSTDKQMSFGRYLQWCRKTKKLGLEVVADDLKVGIGVLKAIENEDLARMPEAVFAKGFLRGFSRIVDADEARVIHDYLLRLQQHQRTVQSNLNLVRENDLFWRKLLVSTTAIATLIFLTVFAATRPEKNTDKASLTTTTVGSALPVMEDNCLDVPGETGMNPEMIRLSVVTVADTWIKITIDNEKIREYTLRPGDRLEFEAIRGYNLLIGNASGIELFANEKPVDIPSDEGNVIKIDIP